MENKFDTRSARERILATAHDLFYREGIRATGIDRIIKESKVTKVTFYRHFPSKNELIRAYLEYRHELWMAWFRGALLRQSAKAASPLGAVVAALREWFESENYRGCAFINAVVEFDGTLPDVAEISRRHKQEMVQVLASTLAWGPAQGKENLVAMAIDGAIIRAQMEGVAEPALQILQAMFVEIAAS